MKTKNTEEFLNCRCPRFNGERAKGPHYEICYEKNNNEDYYLHSDDNYYWTPSAFEEFLKLKNYLVNNQNLLKNLKLKILDLNLSLKDTGFPENSFEIELLKEIIETLEENEKKQL